MLYTVVYIREKVTKRAPVVRKMIEKSIMQNFLNIFNLSRRKLLFLYELLPARNFNFKL